MIYDDAPFPVVTYAGATGYILKGVDSDGDINIFWFDEQDDHYLKGPKFSEKVACRRPLSLALLVVFRTNSVRAA